MIPGILLLVLMRGSSISCTGATNVCSSATPTESCNVLWCCPKEYDDYEVNGGAGPGHGKYVDAGCKRVNGNSSMMADGLDTHTFGEYCKEGEEAPIPGCNCVIEKRRKGGEKWTCDAVFIDGEENNYAFTKTNRPLHFSVGLILSQMSWCLPLIYYCKKQN